MKRYFRGAFTENLNYKLVSLFIAVILWITILGRRDFVHTKFMALDVKTAQGMVVHRSADQVRVRLSGTRSALKKFVENERANTLALDLSGKEPGTYDYELNPEMVKPPLGVKVLSLRPSLVRIEISLPQGETGGEK